MSDFFDSLEAQLHTAARARAGRRTRRLRPPHWLRVTGRALPIVAGVAVAVAVAVIALVVAGHGHGGSGQNAAAPTGPVMRQEAVYLSRATRQAERTPACLTAHPGAYQSIPHHPISPALLSILGVLRRRATPADRLPTALRGAAMSEVRGVYDSFVRRARVKDGVSYYIVPAEANAGQPPPLTARCAGAMVAALHAELPQIPEQLRSPTVALQHRLLAADTRGQRQLAGGVVCLMAIAKTGSGGTCGASVPDVSRYGMLSALHPVSGVVPDGVASVAIHYPAAGGRPAHTAIADVAGNVFVANVVRFGRRVPAPTITWRAADGAIIKTVSATSARTGNASVCQSAHGSGSGVC
jgi:hypothetical protein